MTASWVRLCHLWLKTLSRTFGQSIETFYLQRLLPLILARSKNGCLKWQWLQDRFLLFRVNFMPVCHYEMIMSCSITNPVSSSKLLQTQKSCYCRWHLQKCHHFHFLHLPKPREKVKSYQYLWSFRNNHDVFYKKSCS